MPTSQVTVPFILDISFLLVVTDKWGEKYEGKCPHGSPRPYGRTRVART